MLLARGVYLFFAGCGGAEPPVRAPHCTPVACQGAAALYKCGAQQGRRLAVAAPSGQQI